MLRKRLIGVVTVRNGWAVQSMAYQRYLPLGRPECLVENLDRWGADEILVQVIDRSLRSDGPDFGLLDQLARLGISTPLIYGGGIRSVEDGVQVIQRGADRITVDALLQDELSVARELSAKLGTQAIIASIPVSISGGALSRLDYRTGSTCAISSEFIDEAVRGAFSEVLLTDWQHEGASRGFDDALLDCFQYPDIAVIAFGGISHPQQVKDLLARPNVAAVAVGNFLNYREHAIQEFREMTGGTSLRAASYATEYSFGSDV